MRLVAVLAVPLAAVALGGCVLSQVLFGFPTPQITQSRPGPIELAYREGPGGLVLLTGRVDGRADVAFILDTGAPVTVLLDGPHTAALGLDTRDARPLGDPKDPASPVGVIRPGFALEFGAVSVRGLTAVVVPQHTLPCPEKFAAVDFGGVIGADLFRRFVVEIDTVARTVRLHEPATWPLPPGAASTPLAFRGGHPYLHVPVMLASGKRLEAELHLDTGMNRGLALNAGSHPDLHFPAEGKTLRKCLVNGVREDREGPRTAISLGTRELVDEKPSFAPPGQVIADQKHGSVGIGLFRGQRIAIDYPGRRLLLLPSGSDSQR